MGGGMRVEEMVVGLKKERGMTEKRVQLERVLLFLSVFASRTHKSAARQSGCSYPGKVPIK